MTQDKPTQVALVGAGDEAMELIVGLLEDDRVVLAAILDPFPRDIPNRVEALLRERKPELLERFHPFLTEDPGRIAVEVPVDVIVDATPPGVHDLAERLHEAITPRSAQRMNVLSARMVWGSKADSPAPTASPAPDDRRRVLRSLHEIIQAQNLAIDENDLLSLILDTAIRSTGADRGSLMLLDRSDNLLKVRVAQGIEAELIPKIRFPLGQGIAGKVAQEGTPILISGKADPSRFHLLRDRGDVQSALSVPLTVEDKVIGVLNVSSRHAGKEFAESDLEFLTELAGLEAQIILRSEEMRELRESVATLKTTRQVNQILSSAQPLDERLTRFCALIGEWVPGSSCAVFLADEGGSLVQRAAFPAHTRAPEGSRIAQKAGIEQWAHREHEAVVLRDAPASLGGENPLRKAYAVIPLLAGETSLGLLAVQVLAADGLLPADESLLRSVAPPLAAAVSSTLREETITRYATRVGAINEAGLRLLATEGLDDLVKMATASAGMLLQCDAAVLRLRDPETGRFTIRSYFGTADARLQMGLFAFDKKFVIHLLRQREPTLIPDVSEVPDLAGESPPVRSALGVPLRHPNGALGTLAVYDKLVPTSFYPVAFSAEDREVLVRFTGYVERSVIQATFLERTRKATQFDEATGLPNRAFIDRRLRDELERTKRHHRQIALMTCRLANHPEFVEKMGKDAGRRLVIKVSEILRDNLRGFDVVARIDTLGFGILFPEPGVDALETITRLSHSLSDSVQADLPPDAPIQVQLHYGYAFYPEDGDTAEALWEKAEQVRIRTQ
jgi:diguanylate cyclase (GGDEF)-like protein